MTRYQGGKNGAGVYQTIINAIPRHHTYVEAFAGSAAVFRHKAPAASSLLIERDPAQAMRLLELASSRVAVLQADAIEILHRRFVRDGTARPGVFVYLDPPYHPEARRDLSLYACELTAADHAQLLDTLLPAMSDRRVLWALSGYRSASYDDAAGRHGWHRLDYQAMTRRGVVTESLWTNYDPAAVQLHDYRHLGRDFRERERIARKVRRWVMGLGRLPRHEREAILAALASTAVAGDEIPAPARTAAAGDGRRAPGAIAAPGGGVLQRG